MCTIYEFPVGKLPKEMEERLLNHAEEYVELLYDFLSWFDDDCYDEEELQEIMEMVMKVYTEGIGKAIDKLEF